MNSTAAISRRRNIAAGAFAIGLVVAVSLAGQATTSPSLTPWYAGLAKPPLNLPNWVFGPVWSALYTLMAFALWRVLRLLPSHARRRALLLFFAQLALNATWSWMFFAARSPLLGLINIVPQWLAVAATVIAFARLDRPAAWCLVPLAAWVAYAAVLNAAIWWLNG